MVTEVGRIARLRHRKQMVEGFIVAPILGEALVRATEVVEELEHLSCAERLEREALRRAPHTEMSLRPGKWRAMSASTSTSSRFSKISSTSENMSSGVSDPADGCAPPARGNDCTRSGHFCSRYVHFSCAARTRTQLIK
jgi:hypothetical protein